MRSQVRHWLDLLANARLVPSPIQLLPKLRHIQVTSEHGEQTGVTDNWRDKLSRNQWTPPARLIYFLVR